LPPPAAPFTDRLARLRAFEAGVGNILRMYLDKPLTDETFRKIEGDIILSMSPEAKAEMLCYTNYIVVNVTGHRWRTGWFWRRVEHRRLTAEIIYDPYLSRLVEHS
jgi:hypothetical protein